MMKQKSEITNELYEAEDCVFFRNYVQAAKYVNWGAKLIDLFVGSDEKFVFVFSKVDHNKYKLRWGSTKDKK